MEQLRNNNKKPLKVVWICHFSNPTIRSFLPLKNGVTYQDYAPWISNTINQFSRDTDTQLYVVAPHNGLKRLMFRFKDQGISYVFFKSDIPLVHKKLWKFRGVFLNRFVHDHYITNKILVRLIIGRIVPDIIHLQGAENPRYSTTALQFLDKYPIVVNLQKASFDYVYDKTRKAQEIEATEKKILNTFSNFSVRTEQMRRQLLQFYPHAKAYWVSYAMAELAPIEVKKVYDLVFFARLSSEKGIEDLIRVLPIILKQLPNLSLLVIGEANVTFLADLKNLAASLGVLDIITWKGHLPTIQEVHYEASRARVSALPAHYDVIPGTIIESMQLGIPVVSYKAGSIPELNEERENILLVEIGDIQGLANNIVRLLVDEKLYNLMSQRGIECVKKKFGNDQVLKQHLQCYHDVITNSNLA